MIDLHAIWKLGERIELWLDGEAYRSVVQDVQTPLEALVSQLTRGTQTLTVPAGKSVRVVLHHADGIFWFSAETDGVAVNGPLRMLRLRALETPKRWQRRANLRLQLARVARYQGDGRRAAVPCVTRNIGAAGALLACLQPLEVGESGVVHLTLDEQTGLDIACRVCRVEDREEGQASFDTAVRFEELSQPLLRYLTRHLMEEPMKNRQTP